MSFARWVSASFPSKTDVNIAEFDCFHCGKSTRYVTKSLADLETEYWKDRYQKLHEIIDGFSYREKYAIGRLRAGLKNDLSERSDLIELSEQAKGHIESLRAMIGKVEAENRRLLDIMEGNKT